MFAYLSLHYMETTARKTDWTDSRILPLQSSLHVVFVSVHTMQPKSNKQCKFTGHVSNQFYPTELLQSNCRRNWPLHFIFVSMERYWNGLQGRQLPSWSLKNKSLLSCPTPVTINIWQVKCYHIANRLRQGKKWERTYWYRFIGTVVLISKEFFSFFGTCSPESANRSAWEVSGPYAMSQAMVWSGFYTCGMAGAEEPTFRTELQLQQTPYREDSQLAQVLLKAAGRSQSQGSRTYVINTCQIKQEQELGLARMISRGRR